MAYRAIDRVIDMNGMPASYILQEDSGMVQEIAAKEVKSSIRYKRALVYNLGITRDNRLVYLEKYNMLGLCVPANEFFSYKYGNWQLTPPNNNEPVVMAYNMITGTRIYIGVALSQNGLEYMVYPLKYPKNFIRILRTSRSTIDNNVIPSALNNFSKLT